MAQSGYSAYYPQSPYAYPTPTQPQTSQGYDPRMQPQQQYQQPSYTQPSPTHAHPQSPPVQRPLSRVNTSSYPSTQNMPVQRPPSRVNTAPYPPPQPSPTQQAAFTTGFTTIPHSQPLPIQRPPSRIHPVPYTPGQNGPMTSPLPQHQGQYFSPPSPQPYNTFSANPYPSPISPQAPQPVQPHSARRPLPSPRTLPAPPVNGNQPLPSPQSSPSPGPYVGTHRPTQSVPNAFPAHSRPGPVPRLPSGQDASPTTSAFSATSTSPPRPLPLPRSVGTTNLTSSQSQPQAQPQVSPIRALPAPTPSVLQDQHTSNPEPHPAPGQKFVPMWKRALPQPGGSAISGTTLVTQSQQQIERRSTVSGAAARPLPFPAPPSPAVSVTHAPLTRTGTLPPHLQLQHGPTSPQPRTEAPLTNPPSRSAALPTTNGVSPISRLPARERSRTLPLPSAAPTGPLPPQPTSPRALIRQGIAESPVSSDDEELTNALLERHPRSPSPQYGIRDLPSRSAQWIHSDGHTDTAPQVRRQLPSPGPTSPQPQEMSLASRMAAAELRSTSPSPTFRPGHNPSRSTSSAQAPSAPSSRPMPQLPSQAQNQQSAWPSGLPPLPRAPGSNGPPASQSAFAQMQARALPRPTRSNTTAATTFSHPRSPRKLDLDLNLDDAPPPSLRKSPAPQAVQSRSPALPPSSFPYSVPSRSPGSSVSPLPSAPPMSARSHTAPSNSTLQRSSSDATSVFSLSKFPTPPVAAPASPKKSTFGASSPTRPAFQPPSPSKSQVSGRSHSPVRFQAPAPTTPRTPKISFPASVDGDSDEDDMNGGPMISISGPGGSNGDAPPSLPRISFGDDDGLPSINIGSADDGPAIPQISLPGQPGPSPKKGQAQTRKMQETLSNPRMEAAKRSGLVCGGCGGAIIGRIVSAMDMRWHPGCFRCCVCDELLENLSSYAHDGRPYCHLDYHDVRGARSSGFWS